VILTNPPFGGKEGKEAQTNFDYTTSATQVLFLQHVLRSLRDGGRCGIVLDEGLLFRANEDAFVKTKRKLLDDCDVWCIVSPPAGVFTAAGAGVKTNLLFFTKGTPTRTIWYYDLTGVKVRKKTPLLLQHFDEFFRLLPSRADSEWSWTVDIQERRRQAAAESRPFKEQAVRQGQEAEQWKERVRQLKKAEPVDEGAVAQAEEEVRQRTRAAREAAAKAKEIEDAAFDLKAVNPHKKPTVDARTPEELLDLIEAKGREIAEAIALLRQHSAPNVRESG
jgi:type I restriction enzyme M protein